MQEVEVLMRAYRERSRTRRQWGKQLAEKSVETLAVVPVKKSRVARMMAEVPRRGTCRAPSRPRLVVAPVAMTVLSQVLIKKIDSADNIGHISSKT